MGAVSVTWDQCRAMAPQNCCCHLQVWGNPLVLLSCLSPVSRDTAGFGGAGSPPPPCQGGPSVPPCPAAPGTPKPHSRTTKGFVPFWDQKGAFRTKEGAEAVVGAAVPSRPVQRQNKPKACPCPCPCPFRVRAHVQIHAHTPPTAGVARAMPRGRPPSPSRAGSPWAPQPRAGSVPSRLSPGVPPVPRLPLASGRWLFSWKSGGGGSVS